MIRKMALGLALMALVGLLACQAAAEPLPVIQFTDNGQSGPAVPAASLDELNATVDAYVAMQRAAEAAAAAERAAADKAVADAAAAAAGEPEAGEAKAETGMDQARPEPEAPVAADLPDGPSVEPTVGPTTEPEPEMPAVEVVEETAEDRMDSVDNGALDGGGGGSESGEDGTVEREIREGPPLAADFLDSFRHEFRLAVGGDEDTGDGLVSRQLMTHSGVGVVSGVVALTCSREQESFGTVLSDRVWIVDSGETYRAEAGGEPELRRREDPVVAAVLSGCFGTREFWSGVEDLADLADVDYVEEEIEGIGVRVYDLMDYGGIEGLDPFDLVRKGLLPGTVGSSDVGAGEESGSEAGSETADGVGEEGMGDGGGAGNGSESDSGAGGQGDGGDVETGGEGADGAGAEGNGEDAGSGDGDGGGGPPWFGSLGSAESLDYRMELCELTVAVEGGYPVGLVVEYSLGRSYLEPFGFEAPEGIEFPLTLALQGEIYAINDGTVSLPQPGE